MVTLTYVFVVKRGEIEVVVSAKTLIEAIAKAKSKAEDLKLSVSDEFIRRVEYAGI